RALDQLAAGRAEPTELVDPQIHADHAGQGLHDPARTATDVQGGATRLGSHERVDHLEPAALPTALERDPGVEGAVVVIRRADGVPEAQQSSERLEIGEPELHHANP